MIEAQFIISSFRPKGAAQALPERKGMVAEGGQAKGSAGRLK